MVRPSDDTMNLLSNVKQELVEYLPPLFAKLYSQHTRLRESGTGLLNWRDSEASERLNDAMRILEAAFIEREAGSNNWRSGVRRAGELLEWLSHPDLNPDKLPIRLLSAAVYQIAGYPARATGLLLGDSHDHAESEILYSLLSVDFPELFRLLAGYWETAASPEERMEMKFPWHDSEELSEKIGQWIVGETVSSLGVLCAEMRWGDEPRTKKAIDKLSAIAKALIHGDDPYSWLLARLCAEAASSYLQDSLRNHVKQLSKGMSSEGKDALECYLRRRYQTRKLLAWPSQIRGIKRLANKESFALCTPTGSGKTAVAELAILQSLFPERSLPSEQDSISDVLRHFMEMSEQSSTPLVIYLVPKRALAAEVEAKLSHVLRHLGEGIEEIIVTGLYGGTDWGPTDAWLTRDERAVLICTYEKAEALIRFLGIVFLNRVALVVIDEAHSVQFDGNVDLLRIAENRSLRLEWLVTRLIAHLGESRFIALSAVASGCENEIASWVTGEASARPERSAYRSIRQLIGRLECLPDRMFRILYDLADGDELQFEVDGRFDRPYIPTPFPAYPPAPSWERLGPEKRLRPYLFWAAIHLAAPDDSGQQHSVLISITQHIGGFAEDFLKLLNSTWATKEKPEFFQPPTDAKKKELWEKCKKSCEDYFGEKSREYRLLEKGVVVHHGKMPGLTARLLVESIQQRIVNLVLATSTLSEGVNLPFETILIPSLKRWTGSKVDYIDAREFSNLVGRAGRPGFGTEGRSLVLLQPTERRSGRRYFSLIREIAAQDGTCDDDALARSPLAELLNHLEEKWRIVANDTSRSAFLEWLEQTAPLEVEENTVSDGELTAIETLDSLDSLLLSAIVEIEQTSSADLSADELEERLKEIWQRSYARFASTKEAELGEVFIRRGQALRSDIYPEPIRRRRLYRTSLPPRSGDQMLKLYPTIKEHLETGTEYALWEANERFEYIQVLVEQISSLGKFELKGSIGKKVNWKDILRWWLDPKNAMQPTATQVSKWHQYLTYSHD